MTTLELFSEPFARTGNIAGEGFGNLLGRPTLGMIQTVIRESIQNSVDAARFGGGPSVLLRVRTLAPDEFALLRGELLRGLPEESQSRNKLRQSLEAESIRVMEICDFNTTGLGGPLSADAPADGESPDFVNFVRNVGAPRDTDQGGGTYGYGKTVLYGMSRCSTILVDTLTTYRKRLERRFIGCHLGAAYDANVPGVGRRRFTGRHWWGHCVEPGAVDPVLDDSAENLAARLGMPARGRGDAGTSVMILDPLFDSDDDREIFDELAETVLWNFWPRMVGSTPDARRLNVLVEIEGQARQLPTPEDFPPLDLFAEALQANRDSSSETKLIECLRPKRTLGRLALARGARGMRASAAERENSMVPEQSAHIALMRPVELVVRYLEGTPYPDDRFEWAGVFVCSDEKDIEEAFARAEPPAHDDWLFENLPSGEHKSFVRVALRRLNDWARDFAAPRIRIDEDESRSPSLARAATILGTMLGETEGQSPGRRREPRNSRKQRVRRGVSLPVFERLEEDNDSSMCAVFSASLSCSEGGQYLRAVPHLVMDGGPTSDAGLGQDFQVTVLRMMLESSGKTVADDIMEVGEINDTIEVHVAMPGSAAVGLSLTLGGKDI